MLWGVYTIWVATLTRLNLKVLTGPLRAQSWGDAVGAFLQSEWRHSHYPTWKVLRGAPAPKVGGGRSKGVFYDVSGDTHTTPLGRCCGDCSRMGGLLRRAPALKVWGIALGVFLQSEW